MRLEVQMGTESSLALSRSGKYPAVTHSFQSHSREPARGTEVRFGSKQSNCITYSLLWFSVLYFDFTVSVEEGLDRETAQW